MPKTTARKSTISAASDNDVAASIEEVFTEVGVQHQSSNSAFASLVEEVLAE